MADFFTSGYRYYYEQLPSYMRPIYVNIYNGLKNQRTDFSFYAQKHNGVNPPREIIKKILDHVINDNPALYYICGSNVHAFYSFASGEVRITYTDHYTPQQHLQLRQNLIQRAEPILDFLRGKIGEYPKVYDLYRYMIATIQYAQDFSRVSTKKSLETASIIGPLLYRSTICAGYSKMFKLLCDQLGIDCIYVSGTANGKYGWDAHAWNLVRINGNFYHIDVTFDSGNFRATQKYDYKYYLLSDKAIQKDHKWDRNLYPSVPNNYPR